MVARERLARYTPEIRGRLLAVDDTLAALQRLASRACEIWRKARPGRLIGAVAGSVGKTTTKEILAALVGARFRVLKTQGNLNNEYGLPLTLLRLDDSYDAAVVELGMSHRGELAALTRIASPEVGVITRVAVEHLEFFSSIDEIALAERELIENLPWPRATAVLNADDERVAQFAKVARGPVICFGTSPAAQFRAEAIEEHGIEGSAFDFVSPGGRMRLRLPLIGRHNVMNALAALAAASVWGIGAGEAQRVFRQAAAGGQARRSGALRGRIYGDQRLLQFESRGAGRADAAACRDSRISAADSRGGRDARAGRHPRRNCTANAAATLPALGKIDWIFGVRGNAAEFLSAAVAGGPSREARAVFREFGRRGEISCRVFCSPANLLLLKGSRGVRMEKILEAIEAQHARAGRETSGAAGGNIAERARLMLYYLFFFALRPHFSPLNVFRYITVRTAVASLTALLLSLILGPWIIAQLRELQVKQYIREEGPKGHQTKAGTPTMGGVLIVASIVLPTLLWADLRNPYVLLAVGATLAFGAIGFIDDYNKVVRKQNQGLTARGKFLLQVLTCVAVGGVLLGLQVTGAYSTQLSVPFLKRLHPDLVIDSLLAHRFIWPLAFVPFVLFLVLVIAGISNGVNLTDGLDGLAIGCVLVSAAALTVLTYLSSNARFAEYLEIQKIPDAAELTIFCGSLVGASLGFLWYNAHPAEMFMGDVGSLALGGAIGVVAVILKQEILLISIGGIFILELLSVIIQVGSFKLTGKRVFRMAPLHHHFELMGWSESKIIVRFWILALVFALFSLTTLKLR